MSNPNLTSLNFAIEYELPKLSLVLTFMVAADSEEEALADFRKFRPHGRILKINGQPVKDDGVVLIRSEGSKTGSQLNSAKSENPSPDHFTDQAKHLY